MWNPREYTGPRTTAQSGRGLRRLARLCLLASFTALFARPAAADPPGAQVSNLEPAANYVPWGNPLEGGAIRALVVAPRFTLRDVEELARRLELEYKVAAVWDRGHLGADPMLDEAFAAGWTPEEVEARLLALLEEKADVLLLGNLAADMLPEAVQRRIIKRVQEGMGLVAAHLLAPAGSGYVRRGDRLRQFLADPLPLPEGETAPPWTESQPVRLGRAGPGRVVVFAWPGGTPERHFLLGRPLTLQASLPDAVEADYALVARGVRWAAGRTPALRIREVAYAGPEGPSAEEVPPELPREFVEAMRDSLMAQPLRPYRVFFDRPAPRRCAVRVRVRRPDSPVHRVYEYAAGAAEGAVSYAFEAPIGPGPHFLDVWLLGRKGVISWHTTRVEVEGWPELTRVEYGKNYLMPNDRLDIRAAVRPSFSERRKCRLYARAVDVYGGPTTPGGRVVAQTSVDVPEGEKTVTLRLNFADLLAPLVRVEVFAAESESPEFGPWEFNTGDRDYCYLTVRLPEPAGKPYTAVMASNLEEWNTRVYLEALYRHGISTVYAAGTESNLFHSARLGLRLLPEVATFAVETAAGGTVRAPCLTDPQYAAVVKRKVQEATVSQWAGGSGRYSLGAANCLCASAEPVCQSETCKADFGKALSAAYGRMAALNRAWGTGFAAWEAVAPMPESHSAAPYVDFRMHMDTVFADFHGRARAWVRQSDSEGRAGAGLRDDGNPRHAAWTAGMAEEADFIAVPPKLQMGEKVRSFKRGGAGNALVLRGEDMPDTPPMGRWLAWHGLLHQLGGLWAASPAGTASKPVWRGAMSPGGRLTESFAALAEARRTAHAGWGELLCLADWDAGGVAIYDSRRSRHLNDFDRGFPGDSLAAEQAFAEALTGLGYQYDFVDAEGLARAGKRYRLLMLPSVRAMAEAEVAAVRAFAEAGGALVADVAPGTHDGHGVPRQKGPLDDLFGVRRTGPFTPAGLLLGGVRCTADRTVHPVEGASSTPVDETVIWIRGAHEEGRSLLLNHTVSPRGAEGLAAWAGAVKQALQTAGCAMALPETDEPVQGWCERFHYQYGPAELYGVLAAADSPRRGPTLRLRFNKEDHVYDLLAGEPVSRPHRMRSRLSPAEVRLWSVLPYAVERLNVLVPEESAAGRRLRVGIAIQAEAATPGTHLVRVRIRPANGPWLVHYAKTVACKVGTGEVYIPLAQNELQGAYVIEARDLLTGQATQATTQIVR